MTPQRALKMIEASEPTAAEKPLDALITQLYNHQPTAVWCSKTLTRVIFDQSWTKHWSAFPVRRFVGLLAVYTPETVVAKMRQRLRRTARRQFKAGSATDVTLTKLFAITFGMCGQELASTETLLCDVLTTANDATICAIALFLEGYPPDVFVATRQAFRYHPRVKKLSPSNARVWRARR